MKRGEIWVGNLNPSRGRYIGKIRPVPILQADELTQTRPVYPGFKRWRISLPARDRLPKPCQLITDQPRALDRERIGEGPLATLTAEEMAAVEKSLRAVMGRL